MGRGGKRIKLSKTNKRKLIGLLIVSFIFYWFFPAQLFDVQYSTILNDSEGNLLSAKIAKDGQWRFPQVDSIPEELESCILYFEDEYFYQHPGVNPVSLIRATSQNINAGHTVSGGSTITMQVIRMSRNNPERSYWEKIKEIYLAFRMEWTYSKEEILKLYVSHAPYGGNVVGAEAAAWRYFNRPLDHLSWAEYATLAVLPNAPALIRPGKNNSALKNKRDRLLKKLMENEVIDSSTYSLSLLEELPGRPVDLPSNANHLLEFLSKRGGKGQKIRSTINGQLQKQATESLNVYVKHLQENNVRNACALIVDLEEASIKAYVGNAGFKGANAAFVDLIQSRRSSGSILKPFLYANAVEEGQIHTSTLVRDVPVSINGFSPSNFNKRYDGVVPASQALSRSLNIPATNILKEYGLVRFYEQLKRLGFTTIDRSADNYGLTLILGGAEVSLWEVAHTYANQARKLNAFFNDDETFKTGLKLTDTDVLSNSNDTYDYGTWWLITKALTEVQRPGIEEDWKRFSSSKEVAWKTGTSFGFRDAWAVGYNAKYLVAVWVGNAQGDGRPGLTGVSTAAPLMFELFRYLGPSKWFQKPEADLKTVNLCQNSGFASTPNCPGVKAEVVAKSKLPSPCPYHQLIHLDSNHQQVYRTCYDGGEIIDTSWFILGPIVSHYYKQNHPGYESPPAFSKLCSDNEQSVLAILYPQDKTEIIIPKDFDGQPEKVVAEATHEGLNNILFWHLDNRYVGQTNGNHQMALDISPGEHQLSVLDENGNQSVVSFVGH